MSAACETSLLGRATAEEAEEYLLDVVNRRRTWPRADALGAPKAAHGGGPVVCLCVDVEPQTYTHTVSMVNPFGVTRPIVDIDVCIATTVAELWHQGIPTFGSCCGHGDDEAWVNVDEESYAKMRQLGWRQDTNPDRPQAWYAPQGTVVTHPPTWGYQRGVEMERARAAGWPS